MEVIQFPPTKDPLAFNGMGIKINVEEQCEFFNALFTSVQTALRFCNFDHVKAEEVVRNSLDEDDGLFIDEMGSDWAESVEYIESIAAALKAALARLEVSEDRALGRTRKRS